MGSGNLLFINTRSLPWKTSWKIYFFSLFLTLAPCAGASKMPGKSSPMEPHSQLWFYLFLSAICSSTHWSLVSAFTKLLAMLEKEVSILQTTHWHSGFPSNSQVVVNDFRSNVLNRWICTKVTHCGGCVRKEGPGNTLMGTHGHLLLSLGSSNWPRNTSGLIVIQ